MCFSNEMALEIYGTAFAIETSVCIWLCFRVIAKNPLFNNYFPKKLKGRNKCGVIFKGLSSYDSKKKSEFVQISVKNVRFSDLDIIWLISLYTKWNIPSLKRKLVRTSQFFRNLLNNDTIFLSKKNRKTTDGCYKAIFLVTVLNYMHFNANYFWH